MNYKSTAITVVLIMLLSVMTGCNNNDGDSLNSNTKQVTATESSKEILYFNPCAEEQSSIVDALNSIGVDSSYAYRKKIAEINNISDFTDSDSQNAEMLEMLKNGKLLMPAQNGDKVQETNAEDVQTETRERNIVHPIKVNISNDTDSTLKTYESVSEIDLNRPQNLQPSQIFLGWNNDETITQIAAKTADVTSIINLSIDSIDISEIQNVVYNDAVYVDDDIPTQFMVPVKVGGETSFNTLDLEIEYDSSLMEFIEFLNVDSDAVCNCVTDENKIYISFASASTINAELDLCEITFKTITKDSAETALKYTVKDMSVLDEATSDFVAVKFNIIDGKIVMY